jgi:hypothetical protein
MANSDPGSDWYYNAYAPMNAAQVSYLTLPYSPGYDADFASSLQWCMQNFAYGFAQYKTQVGLLPSSNGPGFNGPTKS